MEKVKLGLLGTGICANTFHYPALSSLNEYFEIEAIASIDHGKNLSLAGRYGISVIYDNHEDLFRDPNVEAVISSYPYFLNTDVVKAAKKYQKHLLIEKPIAKSISLAKEIAEMDDHSIVLGVAENWLYRNCVQKIRELITADTIGSVKEYNIFSLYHMDLESEYLRGKAWRKTTEGGMILDRTIHAVAMMRGLFGDVKRATGVVNSIRPELGDVDTMMAILEYDKGIHGTVINSASVPNVALPYSLIIIGEKGSICCADFHSKLVVAKESGEEIHLVDNEDQGYRAEFIDFYHAIREGTPYLSSFAGAYNDLFACMAPLENPGKWVDFAESAD